MAGASLWTPGSGYPGQLDSRPGPASTWLLWLFSRCLPPRLPELLHLTVCAPTIPRALWFTCADCTQKLLDCPAQGSWEGLMRADHPKIPFLGASPPPCDCTSTGRSLLGPLPHPEDVRMSGLGQRSEEGATQDMNAFSCYSGLLLSYAFFHCCCDNSWAGGCLKPYRFFSLTVTEIGSLRRVSLG